MKTIHIILIRVCVLSAPAQNSFHNLNFEAAKIPPGAAPGSPTSTNVAFPDWTVSEGGEALLTYDGASTGGTVISLIDANNVFSDAIQPLDGKYSAFLFGGPFGSATIAQTGLVPGATESLLVDIQAYGTPFEVSLGGQTLDMVPLQSTGAFTLYGANVSLFADHTESLNFTSPATTGQPPPNFLEVDDITFSPSEIPEPETWVLMLFGAAVFALRWLRRVNTSIRTTQLLHYLNFKNRALAGPPLEFEIIGRGPLQIWRSCGAFRWPVPIVKKG